MNNIALIRPHPVSSQQTSNWQTHTSRKYHSLSPNWL